MSLYSVFDAALPIALTVLIQTSLLAFVAVMLTIGLRRRHVECSVVCLWAFVFCAAIPPLAFSLRGTIDDSHRWVVLISSASPNRDFGANGYQSDATSTGGDSTRMLDPRPEVDVDESDEAPVESTDVTSNELLAVSGGTTSIQMTESVPSPEVLPTTDSIKSTKLRTSGDSESTSQGSSLINTGLLGRLFVTTWLAGLLAMVARTCVYARRVRGLLVLATPVQVDWALQIVDEIAERTGLNRSPRLLTSPYYPAPFVIGIIRPTIVVPEFIVDTEDREMLVGVVAHEIGHVKRGDLMSVHLQRFVQQLHWINPLIYLLGMRANRVREEICDNHAIQFSSPAGYSATLLRLAEHVTRSGANRSIAEMPLSILGSRWRLETRVADLLHPHRRTATRLGWPAAMMWTAMISVFAIVICHVVVATSLPAQGTPETPSQEADSDAEQLLQIVLQRSQNWTGKRSDSLRSLRYDYVLGARRQTLEMARGISKVPRSRWEGTTLSTGIHWLVNHPSQFDIQIQTNVPDAKDKNIVRLICRASDPASSIQLAIGNGIEGTWNGYFSHGADQLVLDIDRDRMLPVREQLQSTTITYGDWHRVDDDHSVPGVVTVHRQDMHWEMHFDWVGDAVWLMRYTERGVGSGNSIIARTENVRVNDADVTRKLSSKERQRETSLQPVRDLMAHNRIWLQPKLNVAKSLSYTFHTERENIKESCYLDDQGYAVFEVTDDAEGKSEGTGKRMVALPDGSWATGKRSQSYLYWKQPGDRSRSEPFGRQIQHYGCRGCQIDLPLFRLGALPGDVGAVRSSGTWDGTDCDVIMLSGLGRNAKLGAGTMLAFTSWSYVHSIYPATDTLYIDPHRHVPIHETIRGSRDRVFEIDYRDWKEVSSGQWIPMSIRIESDDYFACEYRFQLIENRHWMLKEVTSWFDPDNKSRGVVVDVKADEPSMLWDDAQRQISRTKELFAVTEEADAQFEVKQAELKSTRIEFGRWTKLDGLDLILTVSSPLGLAIKVRTQPSPATELLPVLLFDPRGRMVECGTVTLQESEGVWAGMLNLGTIDATEIASIAVGGRSGPQSNVVETFDANLGDSMAMRVADRDNKRTRVAEFKLERAEDGLFQAQAKVVSIDGPKGFPVFVDIALFDQHGQYISAGRAVESFLVKGEPDIHDVRVSLPLTTPVTAPVRVAISVRNGPTTTAPVGSTWGQFIGFRDVAVETVDLLSSEDPDCHEVAINRIRKQLADGVIDKECFERPRDRERLADRKQLRADLLRPVAHLLTTMLQAHTDAQLARDVARLVGHSGERESVGALLPLLDSSDDATKTVASVALAMLGDDSGYESLPPLLQDSSDSDTTDREVWRRRESLEKDVLIALATLNSERSITLLGQTLMKELNALELGTDAKGRTVIKTPQQRARRIMAIARQTDDSITPWLSKAVEYFDSHPEVGDVFDQSLLATALLAHGDATRDIIADQIRNCRLPYIYQIKETRNPYFLAAIGDMMRNPQATSWMFQKGVDYLWNLGSPEAKSLLNEIYRRDAAPDLDAKMRLGQCLVYFGDKRGLSDALAVMAKTYSDNEAAPVAEDLEDQREMVDDILRRASRDMILDVVGSSIESNDVATCRAIVAFLARAGTLPPKVEAAVREWANGDDARLNIEARKLLESRLLWVNAE